MTQAVTPQQMRQLEQQADRLGVSYQQMMQNAGTGIAQGVFQDMLTQEERRLVALCGKGNNGGDGFVAAGLLADMGVRVQVILTQGLPSREPAAWAYREYVQSRDIPVISLAQQPQQALEALAQTHGVLDAIFGTGFSGRLPEDLLPLLSAVKPYQRVYAADLPSGCDAATGQASPGTLKACRTFSLGFYKLGQFLEPCKGLCGSVSRVPIGMPKGCVPSPRSMLVEQEDLVHFLRDLPPDAHKGSQGRLVCVTGCRQYPGACYLSAAAAAAPVWASSRWPPPARPWTPSFP